MLTKSSIEWVKQSNGTAGYEWNPAPGGNWEWKEYNRAFPAQTSVIFINSDISTWEEIWIKDLLFRIESSANHIFLLKSRDICIYGNHEFPGNCWLGLEIDSDMQLLRQEYLYNTSRMLIINRFFLIIHIIEKVTGYFFYRADFTILDGNHKTQPEWGQRIIDACNNKGKMYFVMPGLYNKVRNKKNRIPGFFDTFN